MTDQQYQTAYQRGLSSRSPANREACPSPEQLHALVDRVGTEAERLATLDHIMACPLCLEDFELLRSLATARPETPARRLALLAIAATIAFVVSGLLLWKALMPPRVLQDEVRGEPAALTLISPVGEIRAGAPIHFSWRSVPDAATYSMELLAPAGAVVFAAQVRDTFLVLPDSVNLTTGTPYQWWVRASYNSGRVDRSRLVRFTLIAP